MATLKTLKSRLPVLRPSLPSMPTGKESRPKGRPWERVRVRILRRDNGLCRCATCTATGRLLPAHEVDHVVPRWKGGSDDDDNLAAINRDCHRAKTDAEERERRAAGL